MHGFHKAIEKRLTALERLVGTIAEPETAAATSRRLELCRMALAGETPEDLDDGERPMFPKIQASVPILHEIIHEGLVDAYLDGDGHRDDPLDDRPHEDEDEDEDEDGDDFGEQRYSVGWPRDRPERKGPRGAEYMGA